MFCFSYLGKETKTVKITVWCCLYIKQNNVTLFYINQTKTQIYEEDFSKAAIYSQQKKFYKIIDMLKKTLNAAFPAYKIYLI